MKNRALTYLGLYLLISFTVSFSQNNSSTEIIVKFKAEMNKSLRKRDYLRESKPLFQRIENQAGLNRIYKIHIDSTQKIDWLLDILESDPAVEYAQRNHIFRVHSQPNDPLYSEQWYLRKISAEQAWSTETGDSTVLVAIIDTGIDYVHEDLASNIWINPAEDLNSNGRVDSSDFNYIDDDGNGFIDDIHGWDFTDAPNFPDGGDYLDPDNDPADEHGHGTSVAGIIAARTNNELGIAGIAPDCRLLNLRAGTAQGLLEEEDVATAIVYAADNGARIINMSFGDIAASPLLQDVMQYASQNNCVLIASAGNSASDEIHYPSGYNETISVAATNESDYPASFSNFGTTIDLTAPGRNLKTTTRNNQYGNFSGTSAAAPVVSGVAALLLSQKPYLSAAEIRKILIAAVDDLGTAGRDNNYGSGRINSFKALNIDMISQAVIDQPQLDQGYSQSPVAVFGTASGALLQNYQLFYGAGNNPDKWIQFHQSEQQVIDDRLGEWNFDNIQDTSYTIRLRVNNVDGSAVETMTRIFIDRSAPFISNITVTKMLDGVRPSALIEFETDDLSSSSIFFRSEGTNKVFKEIKLHYITRIHRFNFTTENGWGRFEFFVQCENNAGIVAQTDIFYDEYIELEPFDISRSFLTEAPFELSRGLLFHKVVDLNRNGLPEIVSNSFGADDAFNTFSIYEFDETIFQKVYESSGLAIPRDIGDSDGDGLYEILCGAGATSFVLEAKNMSEFPSEVVWQDSSDFWASRYSDLDRDGKTEIIGRRGDTFQILEFDGIDSYSQVASLENPTEGTNATGIPRSEIADFDNDGALEVLLGDHDGDVYIYEASGDDTYESMWNERQPLMDCINFIAAGDFDGDEISEFAVGSHSSPDINSEHEYDARHWIWRIYKSNGDNSYSIIWEQAIFGYESINSTTNGITAGDVDNDGIDELILNVFPDLYIIDYDSEQQSYYAAWHFSPNNSQSNIIGDINADGINELFVNTGLRIESYYHPGNDFQKLPAPSGFTAHPLDENQVLLNWNAVDQADEYLVFKGIDESKMHQVTIAEQLFYLDNSVSSDSVYWYSVAGRSAGNTGKRSIAQSVRPGNRPSVEAARFIVPNQVRLSFSEPMNYSIKNPVHYLFSHDLGTPNSVIAARSMQDVILTVAENSLPAGEYSIFVSNVFDANHTPMDTTKNSIRFEIPESIPAPYLLRAEMSAEFQIKLFFSQQLEAQSALDINNYLIDPPVRIRQADFANKDSSIVILQLDNKSPISSSGEIMTLTVRNVKNIFGIPIVAGQGDQASLNFIKTNLDDVYVYPNPCRTDESEYVSFANLTAEALIRILNTEGQIIREITEINGDGKAKWNLKTNSGQAVTAGIYIFYISHGKQKKIGKFAIIR